MMGLGSALFEEMRFNDNGTLLNPSFTDYKIPTASDIPNMTCLIVEEPHAEGPYGAKGMGEMPVTITAPALANAIYDAVGVRIKDLPITPEKVLAALKEQGSDK